MPKKKKIIGYESLARWVKNDQVIYPDKFISLIEKYGLIESFTNVIIIKVIADLTKFSENTWVSINITAEHLETNILLNKLMELEWPFPNRIKFELTESQKITDKTKALNVINMLKNKGYCFKLDDYGCGFGNAENLLSLGFTEIKIDRIFIGDTSVASNQNNILLSLIDFSKRCNINVIAEGVEKPSQSKFLLKHGVYFHQGYLYSKPASINDILKRKISFY